VILLCLEIVEVFVVFDDVVFEIGGGEGVLTV